MKLREISVYEEYANSVIDMHTSLGMLELACRWMWIDLANRQTWGEY